MNKLDAKISAEKKKAIRTIDIVQQGLARRYRAERRFRLYGFAAIIASLLFLSLLFFSIVSKGYTAFQQTFIQLDVFFDPAILHQDMLASADYQGLIKQSLLKMFPEVAGRRDKQEIYRLVSSGSYFRLRDLVLQDPDVIGTTQAVWIPADDDVDMLVKGYFDRNAPESARRLKDKQLAWIDRLSAEGRIEKRFNQTFFTAGDSREPELAGIFSGALPPIGNGAAVLRPRCPFGAAMRAEKCLAWGAFRFRRAVSLVGLPYFRRCKASAAGGWGFSFWGDD